MTDTDVDRVIKDAREADKEFYIKDTNGKVIQYYKNTTYTGEEDNDQNNSEAETSVLELIGNLSSSTEIEQKTKEHNLCRSKRLTKTNPFVRLNNPVPSDYRNYRKQTKCTEDNRYRGKTFGTKPAAPKTNQHKQWTRQNRRTGRLTKRGPLRIQRRINGRNTAIENKPPPLVSHHPIAEGGGK